MDEIPFPKQESVQWVGQLPSALLHEGRRRRRRDASHLDPARGEFYNHEHVIRHQTVPRRDFDREEVRSSKHLPSAASGIVSSSCRLAVVAERALCDDGGGYYARSACRWDALDSPGPPGYGATPTTDSLRPCARRAAPPPRRHAVCHTVVVRAPVKLLSNQLLVPAHERIGSREGRHFFQTRAPKRVGE